jgi:hypothetical protein
MVVVDKPQDLLENAFQLQRMRVQMVKFDHIECNQFNFLTFIHDYSEAHDIGSGVDA